MSTNQLLAKALSTTSEDEAIACLRMVRKRGGKLEDSGASTLYKGHDARYWHDLAYTFYREAKKPKAPSDTLGLTQEEQKHLYRMYQDQVSRASRLTEEKRELESEIRKLKNGSNDSWKITVIMAQFLVIIVLLGFIR